MTAAVAPFTTLPPDLEAHEPPEARGVARDRVRLMVAERASGAIAHHRFDALPDLLSPGDVLVVNTSATLPAALDAADAPLQVRFSTPAPHLPGGWHAIEIRTAGGVSPVAPATVAAGQRLELAGGAAVTLAAPYATGARLWLARLELPEAAPSLNAHLAAHGQPIRYAYVPEPWPLAAYQTAFAIPTDPGGSAEMPSAGRPFTPAVIARLVAHGVGFAPLTLDTGVSSPERHEPPYAEPYAVPAPTAHGINAARASGGRVIAVGTTAVRALETQAHPDGTVVPGTGWTDLVISPDRPIRAIDGLITGWHEPAASHLDLLTAIAGPDLLDASYSEALDRRYLWHEFGDSHLVLP
ncbi:S-adenosylmethionine:tRNA ribosyltransferase-isomerase [Baekduia alba]|uniref:S-adenosylmethionine:tRNA ribosyltransferase-isomerase n=1 Tax=Baekduia alba TaxID=2997333 RepID=UPI00233F8DEA|nr:S-adenosylmethionine:tRNA ribosyltransferase-isomerase [Baekduia alba]WCB92183.1 S-adenosylmethionine:tRNA ribosyltransferase-isomerase [Baekduia alba]